MFMTHHVLSLAVDAGVIGRAYKKKNVLSMTTTHEMRPAFLICFYRRCPRALGEEDSALMKRTGGTFLSL